MAALFAWDQSTAFTIATVTACVLSGWLYHSFTRQYGAVVANADSDHADRWISDNETEISPQPPGLIAWAITLFPLSAAFWYISNFSWALLSDVAPVARGAQIIMGAGPILNSLQILVYCGLLAQPHTATQGEKYRTRMRRAMIMSAANVIPPLLVIWGFWMFPGHFYESKFVFGCAVAYALQGRVCLHYVKRSRQESEDSHVVPQSD